MVHKPIKPEEVAKNAEAKQAVDKEWTKLKTMKSKKTNKIGAWDYDTVREKRDVMAEAIRSKQPTHFGSLMVLCHLKNAQLDCKFWSYKGRVVFRGDCVKDEHGHFAVYSEQGTSASHLMAAKFIDAIAHMEGMAGEDSDATGAYIQVELPEGCPPLGSHYPNHSGSQNGEIKTAPGSMTNQLSV